MTSSPVALPSTSGSPAIRRIDGEGLLPRRFLNHALSASANQYLLILGGLGRPILVVCIGTRDRLSIRAWVVLHYLER
jgi:hypothetical protein